MSKDKLISQLLMTLEKVEIEYDGEYPNLCRGNLRVKTLSDSWVFPACCMVSGGEVSFDDDWHEDVTGGPWTINEWPEGFPKDLKEKVLEEINDSIDHGCCGGCV